MLIAVRRILSRGFYFVIHRNERSATTDWWDPGKEQTRGSGQGARNQPGEENHYRASDLYRDRHLLLCGQITEPTDECYRPDSMIHTLYARIERIQAASIEIQEKINASIFYHFNTVSSIMNTAEKGQIINIISNLEQQKWYIPYFSDLETHPVYGNIFSHLDEKQRNEVKTIINEYMVEKIEGLTKTKGGQLFKRFFEAYTDLFRTFRKLNEDPSKDKHNFQTTGKQVENEMFKLEWILTDKMLKQEKGLDKVIDAFYKIVYTYFPKYSQIE